MTIYNQSGVEMILNEDSEVTVIIEGVPVMTMPASEFERIAETFYEYL